MGDLIQEYHREIVECLVQFGKMKKSDAEILLNNSTLLSNVTEESIIFHESPYFWAMNLLYSSVNPNWHEDSNLWPPPENYKAQRQKD